MTVLVILEDVAQARLFVNKYLGPDAKGRNWVIFAPDANARQALADFNVSFISELNFTADIYAGVSERAYILASQWAQRPAFNGINFTHCGIALSGLIERDAIYFFLGILRNVAVIQHLYNQYQPLELWVTTSHPRRSVCFFGDDDGRRTYSQIAKDIAKQRGVTCRELPSNPLNECIHRCRFAVKKVLFGIAGHRLHHQLQAKESTVPDLFSAGIKDCVSQVIQTFYFRKERNSYSAGSEAVLISASEKHVAPVIKSLRKKANLTFVFLRQTFSLRIMNELQKSAGHLSTASLFGPQWIFANFRTEARGFYENWSKVRASFVKDDFFEWNGYSFANLLLPHFDFFFKHMICRLMRLILRFHNICEARKIKRVLVEEDVCVFNKTLVQAAHVMGIPSLVIQHGFSCLRVGFAPLSAACFAAYGDFPKQKLIEWGVAPHKIAVTGNVLHDQSLFHSTPKYSRDAFLTKLGLDPTKKVVLLGMFPYRDYLKSDFPEIEAFSSNYVALLDTILNAMAKLDDVQMIIKLHPRDSKLDFVRSVIEKGRQPGVIVVQNAVFAEIIEHSDCLITAVSTLLVDALPFCKPIILIDFSGLPEPKIQEMIGMPIAVVFNDAAKLSDSIRSALYSGSRSQDNELTRFHLSLNDGLAASRAAELFLNMRLNDR